MKALLLAGGLGTRLRPLTYTRPKHLLPIANRAHIDHVLDLLKRHGINEVVLLTSYLAAAFEDTMRRAGAERVAFEVTHEPEPLGTAGALKNAQSLLGEETFLALNADVLTAADLTGLVSFHRHNGAELTILLTPVDDPSAFGIVPTDDGGRVTGFVEKPEPGEATTNLINAGVYVMEPSVLERIPAGEVWSAERQLFPELVEAGADVYGRPTESYWMDIGTPAKYLQANLDALGGRYHSPLVDPAVSDGVLVASDARVEDGARLVSSVLGSGARVEAGTQIERSVLLPGVVVGEGAVVRDSILGERVHVTAGTTIEEATIGDDERVG